MNAASKWSSVGRFCDDWRQNRRFNILRHLQQWVHFICIRFKEKERQKESAQQFLYQQRQHVLQVDTAAAKVRRWTSSWPSCKSKLQTGNVLTRGRSRGRRWRQKNGVVISQQWEAHRVSWVIKKLRTLIIRTLFWALFVLWGSLFDIHGV